MKVYWEERRKGQRLVLDNESGQREELGGVRETKQGYDAFAKTFGYDPGRAMKGIPTMNDAKEFVESFSPWELFDAHDVTVEPDVKPPFLSE
ncbi:MAG: hypothetical protein QGF12_01120 [SAR202 cluster bacterium]|jgi:hypothetical protein|nr:hypothetical protein [SAR202 cluster bacterium]